MLVLITCCWVLSWWKFMIRSTGVWNALWSESFYEKWKGESEKWKFFARMEACRIELKNINELSFATIFITVCMLLVMKYCAMWAELLDLGMNGFTCARHSCCASVTFEPSWISGWRARYQWWLCAEFPSGSRSLRRPCGSPRRRRRELLPHARSQ